MFASKTPRDLNSDPKPLVCGYANRNGHRIDRHPAGTGGLCGATHDPRPEYDHAQHNKPNPFLVAARGAIAEGATFQNIVDDLDTDGCLVEYPGCEHIESAFDDGYRASAPHHARRVLARLARLTTNHTSHTN